MILVWVLVLACTVSSILSQEVDSRRRTFWIVLITAAPLLGVLVYLPFSFKREDLPFMFQARSTKRRSPQKNRSL